MQNETDAESESATVSEDKFNGSATLEITVPTATDKRTVKRIAEQYFRDTHGTKPSRVVAEKDETAGMFDDMEDHWTVMVSDHNSGSFADTKEYDL